MRPSDPRLRPVLVLLGAVLASCDKPSESTPAPSASASAAATAASAGDASTPPPADSYGVMLGGPYPVEKVVAGVNPGHKPPYAGPKGTLKGVIRIDGDPPPDTKLKFPIRCKDSPAAYGKIFRVGLDKALADAMVAVTQYADRGFVPATAEAVRITAHDCVPDKLTYTVTFGQRMEFFNVDSAGTYLPYLDGGIKSIMVAVPKGPAIKLYLSGPSPAHYMLRDDLGSGMVANVFLLNYATHDVTTLDGHYEIKNIPVGKVRVDVLLPVINKSDGKEIDIVEGDNRFDLTLHFDAAKDMPQRAPADGGAPDAAAPAASASAPPRNKIR